MTTEREVESPTVKVETAIVNGVPIVSEEFVTDCIESGVIPVPIDDHYILHGASGSSAPKKTGKGGSTSASHSVPSSSTVKSSSTSKTATKIDVPGDNPAGPVFAGITFAISGTLSLPRKQIESLITRHGGKVASSVNRSVKYLITTDEEFENGTAKIQAAMDADLPILSEKFLDDCIAKCKIPNNLHPYMCGDEKDGGGDDGEEENDEDGGDGGDGDGEEGEEEDEDEEEEDECEEEKEDVKSLDPGIPPYHGPCIIDSLPSGIFQLFSPYLNLRELLTLYRTGGMRRQLRFSIDSLSIILPDPTNLNWPKCISYFANLKGLSVSCPKWYEHMPIANFDASTISPSVTSLSLSFGNASEIFTQLKLDIHFKSLEMLEISGTQLNPSLFSAASSLSKFSPSSLNGLSHIKLDGIEISANMVSDLPRGLKHISGLVLFDGISPSGTTFSEEKCVLPPHLETLDVACGRLGGLVLKALPPLTKTLRALSMSCVVDPAAMEFPTSDTAFFHFPENVNEVNLAISGGWEGHFSPRFLNFLPRKLTSLVVKELPFTLKTHDLVPIAQLMELKTLRLPDIDAPTLDVLQHIPTGVTDLRLWSTGDTVFTKECLPMLPQGLITLEMNFESDVDNHFSELPQSIEHLRCKSLCWDYGDDDGDDGGDDDGATGLKTPRFPPGLKSFRYTCNYQFLYVALKQMPPTLTSFIADDDCDWEGDELHFPKHLQVFSASSSNFSDEFFEALPKCLKSFSMPLAGDSSSQDGELFHLLPRRLVAFDMFTESHMNITVAHIKKLPKRLAKLRCEARHWTKKHFQALPQTLGELRIPKGDYSNIAVAEIPKLLPRHCRLIFEDPEP